MVVSLEYLATIYTTANYQILPAWREKYFNPTTASLAGRGVYLGFKKLPDCADELVIEGAGLLFGSCGPVATHRPALSCDVSVAIADY